MFLASRSAEDLKGEKNSASESLDVESKNSYINTCDEYLLHVTGRGGGGV